MLFPMFAKPMKICARLFLFYKPIKSKFFAFLFVFCFYVYFSRSYESGTVKNADCRLHVVCRPSVK